MGVHVSCEDTANYIAHSLKHTIASVANSDPNWLALCWQDLRIWSIVFSCLLFLCVYSHVLSDDFDHLDMEQDSTSEFWYEVPLLLVGLCASINLAVIFDKERRHRHGALHISLVVQKKPLQSRCARRAPPWLWRPASSATDNAQLGQRIAKDLLEVFVVLELSVEAIPETLDLVSGGGAQANRHVDPSGSHEGLVEPVDVVCGEEHDAFFGAGDSVEGVEEAGECDGGASVAVFFCLVAAVAEGDVDVFEEDQRSGWDVAEEMVQSVVGEAAFAEIEHGDVVVELACEGLDERRLAGAGGSVE